MRGFENDMEFYHLLNRGVEKRNIVNDDSDRLRFVHSLFVFNDRRPLDENHRRPGMTMSSSDRDRLVDLHAWCLMDNHYHLLVSPIKDTSDISKFMKKLNMGYARYFNEKYSRSGYLWQGKYKKILIENDSHFIYIPYYIHLNPLDTHTKQWRKGKVTDVKKVLEVLGGYRWSSFLDYQKQNNFNSLLNSGFLSSILGTPTEQIAEIKRVVTSPTLPESISQLE